MFDADSLLTEQPVVKDLILCCKDNAAVKHIHEIAFIGMAHILETFLVIPEALISLGAKPEQICFTGKYYSDYQPAIDYLNTRGVKTFSGIRPTKLGYGEESLLDSAAQCWDYYEKHMRFKYKYLIILDEDMSMATAMPSLTLPFEKKIGAVVQTRRGMYNPLVEASLYPIINVAECKAKKEIESPLIAEEILAHIPFRHRREQVFGVVGYGAIGKSITKAIQTNSNKYILVYDPAYKDCGDNDDKIRFSKNLASLFANCSDILFCSGIVDSLDVDPFKYMHRNKNITFYNASSCDLAFKSFLREHCNSSAIDDVLADLTLTNCHGNTSITIKRGGTPINFSNRSRSVSSGKIQLTRGLTLLAMIEAIELNLLTTSVSHSQIKFLSRLYQRQVIELFISYGHLQNEPS